MDNNGKGTTGGKRTRVTSKNGTAFVSAKRRLSYNTAAFQGQGGRSYQEDSFCFVNNNDVVSIMNHGLLAVMADGMGGLAGGKQASEAAVAVMRDGFGTMDTRSGLTSQFKELFARADNSIYNLLDGNGGSTMIAVVIADERMYWCSVGDSTLMLKRGNRVFRLNREHNVRNDAYIEQLEYGSGITINRMSIENDREAACLTSYLGCGNISQFDINIKPLPLHDGDVIMVCSDGVSGVLDDTETALYLSMPPVDASEQIQAAIINKNKPHQDNFTGVIISCEY